MKSDHRVFVGDARRMDELSDDSIELVVTSPPYPMIEMWDETYRSMNPEVGSALETGAGWRAFELMHLELDRVWQECFRVLRPGCIACINVGDATRTIGGDFQLFPNHARIVQSACAMGFATLPDILWRKQTNAPTKFMGSGMLPAGAYVTYEHEYVLILRKGAKRVFKNESEKQARRRSAFFWEERNTWFSDVWMDLKGTGQDLADPETRKRSGAYPFELAYRLIQMYSLAGDTVLDPFLGTGTTTVAAIASARNSVGIEIDPSIAGLVRSVVRSAREIGAARVRERLSSHRRFVRERQQLGRPPKYANKRYGFPVVTLQEVDLELYAPAQVSERSDHHFSVVHSSEVNEEEVVQAEFPLSTS
ncbi:MAG: site-specific DNA-methyltransferase [Planctomycetota bacterium]|nr:site-specific DNA-methyltransferase [Planctomycetota bacterium]